ncbi:golgin subfamily A member 2-like isoform X1 [Argiope bruennichi]|uniref:golgin subfamily A member 2-like isoform X1 n=2 Tax=Argiope bruennichi TaxID=94029 RepID=UPI002494F60C|nr:golgin subfamily A member 2-like isoform X1 [Argiope bruennichi]
MADGISREEKLAAGLKKLKQFQQQRSKAKGSRKKPTSMQTNSSEGSTPTETSAEKIPQEVPTFDDTKYNLEQSINRGSSTLSLNANVDNSEETDTTKGSSLTIQKSKSDLQLNNPKEYSSTESLRQISLQVNGLMSETNAFMNGTVDQEDSISSEENSLEKRNQELALLVNNLRQANDQLHFQLQELKAKNKRLNQNFDQERKELQEKSHKEQVALKDQLQVHIQTIGILVAEKTELQSSLSLSQQTAKQKAGEIEELQGRLRASRQRASDLEREIIALSNSNQQLEKASKESAKDIERLKSENYRISKLNEELKSANAELTEKLNKKIKDLQALELEFAECQKKLSLTQTQAQQFDANGENENRSQLEELYQQKLELEKRLSLNKNSVSKLIMERDQMADQYQQYITQLSQQVTSLRDEIKQHSSEKEQLSKERNLLQEKLEAIQQQNSNIVKDDPSELKVQINILKNQNEELNQKLQNEISNTDSMKKQLEAQNDKIAELEKIIARLKEDQVDKSRLMETMESDKVAASRAVTQNRELKKQLEELQTGFVTMSNDKLKLVEELDSQKHITKELGERLSQQEKELHELQEQLSQREEELQKLHTSSTKGIYQQNQIADRMRHYEAQGQLTEMLQKELHQAQEQINVLTNQNSELRMALATQSVSDESQKEDKDASKRNDLVAQLSASVRQLEMERDQMIKQLEEQKSNRMQLVEQLKERATLLNDDDNGSSDVVSRKEYAMIKNAMTQLEERFKQTMNRIAELSDERQQLEHLVLQLQGETDTIGDYIALYQIQRGLMRKRASEKDEYIAQLARDREDMKAKLGELQNLVMRLLEERKLFQSQTQILDDKINFAEISDLASNKKAISKELIDRSSEREIKVEEDESSSETESSKKPETTAKKIIDLLTEIESTNLVEKPVLENFHPCPVCSGRLITV